MDASVIVASNRERILQNCLLTSPELGLVQEVIIQRGFTSAASAYNSALQKAKTDLLIFVHQDVFLPEGWFASLQKSLTALAEAGLQWGVLGIFGVSRGGAGTGHLYSTGLQRIVGHPFVVPAEVRTLDEILLVLRRSAGLHFDERLPGFHLYGTDVCLEARRHGMKSYAVPAFCIHNSRGIRYLPGAYWKAYGYVRRKWLSQLPIASPCIRITWSCFPVLKYLLWRPLWLLAHSSSVGEPCGSPALLYQKLVEGNVIQAASARQLGASVRPTRSAEAR